VPFILYTAAHNTGSSLSVRNYKPHYGVPVTACVTERIKDKVREDKIIFLGFEVLTAVSTKMAVFWVVAPCSLVEIYQRFRGPCCLHNQGPDNRPDDGGSRDL
jgi:hypothetical protein